MEGGSFPREGRTDTYVLLLPCGAVIRDRARGSGVKISPPSLELTHPLHSTPWHTWTWTKCRKTCTKQIGLPRRTQALPRFVQTIEVCSCMIYGFDAPSVNHQAETLRGCIQPCTEKKRMHVCRQKLKSYVIHQAETLRGCIQPCTEKTRMHVLTLRRVHLDDSPASNWNAPRLQLCTSFEDVLAFFFEGAPWSLALGLVQ